VDTGSVKRIVSAVLMIVGAATIVIGCWHLYLDHKNLHAAVSWIAQVQQAQQQRQQAQKPQP
jgi:uncharacterized membrane protein YiaA